MKKETQNNALEKDAKEQLRCKKFIAWRKLRPCALTDVLWTLDFGHLTLTIRCIMHSYHYTLKANFALNSTLAGGGLSSLGFEPRN